MIDLGTRNHWVGAALMPLIFVISACGGTGDDGNTGDAANEEIPPDAARRGSISTAGATLTIGTQTYAFERVLCAVGSEETGREGTEFSLSAMQDGLQLDATIDARFGHTVSIDDIANRDDPQVSWSAGERGLPGSDDAGELIQVDGDRVTAEATFVDELADTTATGTLTATCP